MGQPGSRADGRPKDDPGCPTLALDWPLTDRRSQPPHAHRSGLSSPRCPDAHTDSRSSRRPVPAPPRCPPDPAHYDLARSRPHRPHRPAPLADAGPSAPDHAGCRRGRPPVSTTGCSNDTPLLAKPDRDADLVVHDADGYRGKPHGAFRTWRSTTPVSGPRHRADSRRRTRIMTLGASETFGLYETRGTDLPGPVAAPRSTRPRDPPTEVVNAAIAGTDAAIDARATGRRWASRFSPARRADLPLAPLLSRRKLACARGAGPRAADAVTATDRHVAARTSGCSIDCAANSRRSASSAPVCIDRPRRRRPARPPSMFGADAAAGPARRLRPRSSSSSATRRAARRRAGARDTRLQDALAARRTATSPSSTYFRILFPRARPEAFPAFAEAARSATIALAQRRGWPLIDAAAQLSGRRNLFADPVHFNDQGSAEMARIIADGLAPLIARLRAHTGRRALMLFNSFVFLFAFLPVTYVVFWSLRTASAALRLARDHRLRLLQLLEPVVLPADGVLDARQLPRRPRLPALHARPPRAGSASSCRSWST